MSANGQTDAGIGPSGDGGGSDRFRAAVDEAVGHRDWAAVADLIDIHWSDLVSSEPQLLLDAILALPTEAYRDRPRLEAAANYLEHLVTGRDPRRYHDYARTRENPTLLDQLVELTSRTAGHRTAGRLTAARGHAREAMRLLGAASDDERADLSNALPDLLLQWGRTLEVADSGNEIRLYEEAYELAQLRGNTVIQRRAAACLAWTTAWHGRLRRAEEWIRRAQEVGPANPRYDAPLHLATTLIHADRFEWDVARRALERSGGVPVGEYWAAAVFVRSRLIETPAEAAVVEGDLETEKQRQPDGLVTAGANAAYLAAARLRFDKVKGGPPVPTAGPPSMQHLQIALHAIAAGDFHTALEEATNLTGTKVHPRARAAGLLLVAAARARLGRRKSSLTAFTEAHAVIGHDGLYSGYLVLPAEDVLQLADAAAIELDERVVAVLRRSGAGGVADRALSPRERQVLKLLATEMPMSEIAQTLFISGNTLKSTTRRLYRKLGVSSRAEAADYAGGPSAAHRNRSGGDATGAGSTR